MLRLLFFCIGLVGLSSRLTAQWSQVGDTIYTNNTVYLATTPDDSIHASYLDVDQKYAVLQYDAAWKKLASPPVKFSRPFFTFEVDRAGFLYIVSDTVDRIVVMKYDGIKWKPVGDPSVFWRTLQGQDPALVFDAQNRPYYATSEPRSIIRYNGTSWEQIAGKLAETGYSAMAANAAGEIFFATTDSNLYRYGGDSTWNALHRTGIEHLRAGPAVMTAASNGRLYAEYLIDSTSLYEYNSLRWLPVGAKLPPALFLSKIQVGAYGQLYALSRSLRINDNTVRLLRYSGDRWEPVAVDTGVFYSHPVMDGAGNLYAAIVDEFSQAVRVMKYDTRNDPVSVPQTRASSGVTLAPNPAENYVTVRCSKVSFLGEPATVSDIQGRVLHRFTLTAETRIETGSWPSGTYYIQIPDGAALEVVKR